ncbi:hypothetical protein EFA69_06600 [Rufibacter immobilis]|uniref:Phage-like element PBSX protein XkdF domain-containing protein n=1 Tax=Rufibacter immobilis TaxID=1348778 RepID=A0A3M9MZQ5_9BACT|nr:XkdF-like putative serine protease domain-containing protein [Rufibacter immobilis]RNI30956.1 hypothetical protein EFA69_06600 [Rufibacter immobilis]
MTRKDIPVYSVTVDDLDEATGISLISIVDRPAIESNFLRLEEETPQPVHLARETEKRYATGAVLIPDKLIYRRDSDTGKEYYLNFESQEIERIRNKFFRTGELKMSNLDHSSEDLIQGFLIESWIVVDAQKDKAVALGFQDVKVGSLYATYHFPSDEIWSQVSERNGFSLEGSFLTNLKMSEQTPETETVEGVLDLLVDFLKGGGANE